MPSPSSIIDDLGGTGQVASALSLSDSTVSGWRTRPGGIPAAYWGAIVKLAADRGRGEITLEALADLAARQSQPEVAEARA